MYRGGVPEKIVLFRVLLCRKGKEDWKGTVKAPTGRGIGRKDCNATQKSRVEGAAGSGC